MKRIIRIIIMAAIFVTPFTASAAPASGALFTAGQGSGSPGSIGVIVPITLETAVGESVASFNFDLHYDVSKLTVQEVTAGPTAVSAEKEVESSLPESGVLRVVVYGINQNAIGDGVVVNISFDIAASASTGSTPLTFSDVVAASPQATEVQSQTSDGSIDISGSPTTFADVPRSHWAYGYIEVLYQEGYIAGCSVEPRKYCPEDILTRAEMAVYVERGIHNAGFTPTDPTTQVFSDVPMTEWFSKWASALWDDEYTAGCGTDPLIFCPLQDHTRAESTVYFERMLHGKDYLPTDPTTQVYDDVPVGTSALWYSKWVNSAYDDQLVQECEDEANRGDNLFRPVDGLTRAEAACVMVKAKGLTPATP